MDNLDRTNVVQATLAKWTLNKQLREAGIIGENAVIEDYPSFAADFRESEWFFIVNMHMLMCMSL